MIGEISEFFDNWNILTVLIRLVLSVVCGGVIGLSRSVKRLNAGFKTHSLVCMGSALVMLTGQYIYESFGNIGDISRLPAQVISGVGFLGAGTIIVTGRAHVKGLTTAAGLWASAGIGISIGIGFYSGGIFATLIILFIYNFMGHIDEIAHSHSKILELYIEFASRSSVSLFISTLKKQNYKVSQMELNKSKKSSDSVVNATLSLETPVRMQHELVVQELSEIEGVDYIEEL